MVERAQIETGALSVRVGNIEIRADGHMVGVQQMPAIGQDCHLFLDGQEVKGWEKISLELERNKFVQVVVQAHSLAALRQREPHPADCPCFECFVAKRKAER